MAHGLFDPAHWVNRRAARTRPDVVVANSRFTAGPAGELFPGVPVEVVYPPVPEPAAFDREAASRVVRVELGTPAGAVVILQASRLEPWKGQALHLHALARVEGVPAWEAWFAGGPQRPDEATFLVSLQQQAARSGTAGRVRFLGQRSDVPRLMAAADLFCQPNTGPEPFGIVFVEALYAGLPVVTTGFGGAAEIVDERCGVLIPPGDPAVVATALGGLIRDPARRQALAAAGPGRAAHLCDPGRQLARLMAALRAASRSEPEGVSAAERARSA
jgi:glycosyltransferase involved in cell wall biosynthesis